MDKRTDGIHHGDSGRAESSPSPAKKETCHLPPCELFELTTSQPPALPPRSPPPAAHHQPPPARGNDDGQQADAVLATSRSSITSSCIENADLKEDETIGVQNYGGSGAEHARMVEVAELSIFYKWDKLVCVPVWSAVTKCLDILCVAPLPPPLPLPLQGEDQPAFTLR